MGGRIAISLLMAVLVVGALVAIPPQALAGEGGNYIYVYPNNAVRVLVNGTYEIGGLKGVGFFDLAITLFPNYTVLRLRQAGTIPAISGLGAPMSSNWVEMMPYNLTGYLYVSGYANKTSNGRLETSDLRINIVYSNESSVVSLNVSSAGSIQAIASPAEYEVSSEVNASAYPSLPSNLSGLTSELGPAFTGPGVSVKEFRVYANSTFLSVDAVYIVNGTPAPPNSTLGLLQALLNAELMPGFLKASYQVSVNFTSGATASSIFLNVSNSELRNLATAIRSLLSAVSAYEEQVSAQQYYVSPYGVNLTSVEELLNATTQIASYIKSNFRVVEPSSEYVNLTFSNSTVKYSIESALFEKAGATSPKQSLAAITYLVGNASEILEANGLQGLAKAVRSLDGVEVTLVGVDGVKVSPTVTTIGNLTSVTVTVSGSSSVTRTAETVGGVTAVAVVLAAVLILLRRH